MEILRMCVMEFRVVRKKIFCGKKKLFVGCEEYVNERLSSSVGRCCQLK